MGGISLNTSYMNANVSPYANTGGFAQGSPSAADEESQSMLEEMQEKLEEMKSTAKGMEEYAKEAPRATKQMILSSMCRQVEAMNPKIYSAKTWNALMKAYGGAKKLMNEEAPTEEQLQKALEALRKALARLETVERKKQAEEDEEREGLPIMLQPPKGGAEAAAEAAAASAAAAVEAAAAGGAPAAAAGSAPAAAAAPAPGASVDVSV